MCDFSFVDLRCLAAEMTAAAPPRSSLGPWRLRVPRRSSMSASPMKADGCPVLPSCTVSRAYRTSSAPQRGKHLHQYHHVIVTTSLIIIVTAVIAHSALTTACPPQLDLHKLQEPLQILALVAVSKFYDEGKIGRALSLPAEGFGPMAGHRLSSRHLT